MIKTSYIQDNKNSLMLKNKIFSQKSLWSKLHLSIAVCKSVREKLQNFITIIVC
jgi:hypothetical protein